MEVALEPTLAAIFRNEGYLKINRARIEHLEFVLDTLNLPRGLSVLEVGAGVGDLTEAWIRRGFQVVTSDAREENVAALKRRFPDLRVLQIDLDTAEPLDETFDVVFAYGVLYHLAYPDRGLDLIAAAARRLVFIETCVSFGATSEINLIHEPAENPAQAYQGMGCRPTRPWVWSALGRRFAHVYQPGCQPDHEQFPLNWVRADADPVGLYRTVFVAARDRVASPVLFPRLLEVQAKLDLEGRPVGRLVDVMATLGVKSVLDVGANLGQFALELRQAGYAGVIVSFEPLAHLGEALLELSATDPLWHVRSLALGAEPGSGHLHVSANSVSSSFLPLERRTINAESTVGYVYGEEVRIETLDRLWPDLKALCPDAVMLKIDAQGFEASILDGAAVYLDQAVLVVLECSLVPIYRGELLVEDMIAKMRGLGFSPVWLQPGWSHKKTGQVYQCDIAFARCIDLPVAAG